MSEEPEQGDVKYVQLCDWPGCLVPATCFGYLMLCSHHTGAMMGSPIYWTGEQLATERVAEARKALRE